MKTSLMAALGIVASASMPAHANQSAVAGGPIGATDIGNAFLPPTPGVYLGVGQAFGYGNRLSDDNYDKHPGAGSALITAAYLGYEYPFRIFGGKLASGFQVGYEAPGRATIPNIGKAYQDDVGWRDLYVDIVNWSRYLGPAFGERFPAQDPRHPVPYGLTVKLEYSMIFPIGHYSSTAVVTPGSNTTFFIPNAAATYMTAPDAFGPVEFNAHLFYDARARNPANDYSNGAIIDVDYAVAQHIRGYAVGFTGGYAVQVQNDTVGPAGHSRIAGSNGDHLDVFTLGPILSIPIPAIHGTFKLKAPFLIRARNTLGLSQVVANLSFPIP